MELLGDVGHVESCFDLFGNSVSVSARWVHDLRQTYHRLRYHFGHTQWYSMVARLNWKLILVHFEVVRILTQDRSMVCAERTIG